MNDMRSKFKERALAAGFKLKQQDDGSMDLHQYVYDFAADMFQAGFDFSAASVPQGEQCPSEIRKITLPDGTTLVLSKGKRWNLLTTSGEHLRYLDQYECEFINSALLAAQPKEPT